MSDEEQSQASAKVSENNFWVSFINANLFPSFHQKGFLFILFLILIIKLIDQALHIEKRIIYFITKLQKCNESYIIKPFKTFLRKIFNIITTLK